MQLITLFEQILYLTWNSESKHRLELYGKRQRLREVDYDE